MLKIGQKFKKYVFERNSCNECIPEEYFLFYSEKLEVERIFWGREALCTSNSPGNKVDSLPGAISIGLEEIWISMISDKVGNFDENFGQSFSFIQVLLDLQKTKVFLQSREDMIKNFWEDIECVDIQM